VSEPERQHDPLPWEPRQVFVAGFLVELGLVAVAAAIGALALGSPFPFRLALDLDGLLWGLGATLPTLVLAFAFTSPLARRLRFLRRIHERVCEILGPAVRAWSAQEILLLSAAAGIGEEILFRGVLQGLSATHGLWISSLVFGLLHALTPAYFVLATALGFYLGWLHGATGNLLAPILVHAIYDTVALLRLRRELRREVG
jgi:hypothetical protein